MAPDAIDWPPEWDAVVQALQEAPGVCPVVGATDVGKSTCCWAVAACLAALGLRVGVLDADLGQARLGPPTTMGFALASADPGHRPEPQALTFVGSTTPQGNLVPTLVAVHKAGDAARAAGAECLIVDTCGWVRGPAARVLKEAKFSLLVPRAIVAIQRERELEHLLGWARGRPGTQLIRLAPSAAVRSRDMDERRRHRASRFRRYFGDAQTFEVEADRVAVLGTSLWGGERVSGHIRRAAESLLEAPLVHAETLDDTYLFVCSQPPSREAVRAVQDLLPEEYVTVRSLDDYRGRLVGLLDEADMCLAVGAMDAIELQSRRLTVRAPAFDRSRLAAIALGRTRLAADFTDSDAGPLAEGREGAA